MKLVTNTAVTINDGQVGTRSTVITGVIKWVHSESTGGKKIGYGYTDDNGNQIPTLVNPFPVSAEEVQPLYDLVKAGLPADTDYELREWTLYYEVFKIKMAETFGIDASVIDIVE